MSRLEEYYKMTEVPPRKWNWPKTSLEMVKEFHEIFGHPVKDTPNVEIDKENNLRTDLIQEELDELKDALKNRDPIETLDALTDLQYVLDGAFLALGFYKFKNAAVAEVHRSNLSKLGEDGKPVYRVIDGKVLKGPNYSPPDLKKVLTNG